MMKPMLLNKPVLRKILRGPHAIFLTLLLSLGMTEAAAGPIPISFIEVLETQGNKVARCLMLKSPEVTQQRRYFCLYGRKGTQKIALTHRDNTVDGKIFYSGTFMPYKEKNIGSKIQGWLSCQDGPTPLCFYDAPIQEIKETLISDQLPNNRNNVLRYELPPESLIFFTDRKAYGKLYQFARGVHVFLRSLQANQPQALVEATQLRECEHTLTDVTQKQFDCEQIFADIRQENAEYEQQLQAFRQQSQATENGLGGFVFLLIGLVIGVILGVVLGFIYLKRKDESTQNALLQMRQSWQAFSGEKTLSAERLNQFLAGVKQTFQAFSLTDHSGLDEKLNQIVVTHKRKMGDLKDEITSQQHQISDLKGTIDAQKDTIKAKEGDIGTQKNTIKAKEEEIGTLKDTITAKERDIDAQLHQIKAKENTIKVYGSVLFDYFYLPALPNQPSDADENRWKTDIIQQQGLRASLKFSFLGEVIACQRAVTALKKQGHAELDLCLKVLEIDKIISDYLENVRQRNFDSDIKMYKEGVATKWLHRVFRAAALLHTYYPDDGDLQALSAHLQTITAMLRAVFVELADLKIQFLEPELLALPPTDCKTEPDVGKDFKKLKAVLARVTERQQQGGQFVVDIRFYGMRYEERAHYGMTVIVYSPAYWQ